jgi:hypothetical protein
VTDRPPVIARTFGLGATPSQPARGFGEGLTDNSVVDPFGNVLGSMHEAHYLTGLAAGTGLR